MNISGSWFFVLLSGRVADSYWKVHSWRKFHAGVGRCESFIWKVAPHVRWDKGLWGCSPNYFHHHWRKKHQQVHNTSVLNFLPSKRRKRLANNDDLGLVITWKSLKRYHILKPKPSLLEAFVFCLRLFPLAGCNGAGLFNSGSPLCANLLIRASLTRGACLKEDRNQLTQKQSTPVLLPQQVNTLSSTFIAFTFDRKAHDLKNHETIFLAKSWVNMTIVQFCLGWDQL